MGSVLYVGADDSNHAGDAKGEFIVATFSLVHDDSVVRDFPNRRDHSVVDDWLGKGGDYRFTICTGEIYKSSQNLPKVVPVLVEKYLAQTDLNISTIKTYLDGRLEKESKEGMKEILLGLGGIEKVVVGNFIKKKNCGGRVFKRPHCPRLVWLADTLANGLYRYSGPVSDILEHEKMIRSSKL